MNYLKDFCNFLINPRGCVKITKAYKLFFSYLFLFSVLYFGLSYFNGWFFEGTDVFVRTKKFSSPISCFVFFRVLVITPLIEEVMFRLIFKPKKIYFIIFLLIWGCICFSINMFFGFIIFSLLVLLVTYYKKLKKIFFKNFNVLVYVSSILFGTMHLMNYNFKWTIINVLLIPVFFLPISFAGICLVFVRMKFGFFYTVIVHSFINLIPLLLFF